MKKTIKIKKPKKIRLTPKEMLNVEWAIMAKTNLLEKEYLATGIVKNFTIMESLENAISKIRIMNGPDDL